MKRCSLLILMVVTASLALGYLWHISYDDRIVAQTQYQRPPYLPLTFIIREYPESDGSDYGCEVRLQHTLLAAALYKWDSFTADHCSIDIKSDKDAIFTIGDHHIHWTHEWWQFSKWELLPRSIPDK